jgi:hypothetical protein
MEYPTLLGGPAPRLWTYPRETVVAEKYQALVTLGMANSRMKDFYDLWVMARDFDFQGESLATAIGNTFARRRTEIPEGNPSGLSSTFASDRQKKIQWQAFLSQMPVENGGPTLSEVCTRLAEFLGPPTEAARRPVTFDATWQHGGPWSEGSRSRC